MSDDPRQMRAQEMVTLDSLISAVFHMQPFLFGRYDRLLLDAYINDALKREVGLFNASDPEVQYAVQLDLREQGPEFSGWLAYTEQRFSDAIDYFNRALDRTNRDRAAIQWNLALAFYQIGDLDGAVSALRQAVIERKKESENRLTHIYESSANYEFMTGWVLERKSDSAGAREAYARALLSDLSFHPAHVRLARIALMAGDTATALDSFATAIDIRPDDAWLRYVHGTLLSQASRLDEALRELKQATQLEPLFASPWYELGRAADLQAELDASASDSPSSAVRAWTRIPSARRSAPRSIANDP